MSLKRTFEKAFRTLRARGFGGVMRAVIARLRRLFAGRARSFQACLGLFAGKSGMEIGGPSQVFARGGIFPVYPVVGQLDNCNFARTTVWEGDIEQGQTFQFDRERPPGRQFVVEATAMGHFPSGAYDFILSSHVLEHTANPVLALSEWIRLLKDHGTLVLLLPHKDRTFDHRRPVTTLEHLIADFSARTTEDDLTHLPEILTLHDLARDLEAGGPEDFAVRSRNNPENRCLHHHVFDTALAVGLVEYMGLRVQAAEEIAPFHILIVARKGAN